MSVIVGSGQLVSGTVVAGDGTLVLTASFYSIGLCTMWVFWQRSSCIESFLMSTFSFFRFTVQNIELAKGGLSFHGKSETLEKGIARM